MNQIFQNMLSRYEPQTKDERTNATHEVMQQIALAGLYQTSFLPNFLNKTTSVAEEYSYSLTSLPH